MVRYIHQPVLDRFSLGLVVLSPIFASFAQFRSRYESRRDPPRSFLHL